MALAYKYSVHGIAWRSAPFREESKSKSATPRKHPGFKARKGSGQGSTGQGKRGQGTGLCRHLSKLTRCSPYPCQPPFSTFRSPVESRLQISDSKLVLIITKYAYVQRNPANGPGDPGDLAVGLPRRPITSSPLPRYLPARTPSRSMALPTHSLNSLTGAQHTRPHPPAG